jgi:hypothetical protein
MTDVAAAEAAAAEAGHQADEAERAAVEGLAEPDVEAVAAAREKFRLARLLAGAARTRRAKAEAAARLAGLEALGADIDQLATAAEGTASAIRSAQLEAIAATARDFRASCQAHDAAVRALARWASSLKLVEIVGGHGPHAENAHVQVLGPARK